MLSLAPSFYSAKDNMPHPLYFLPGLMCDHRLWQDVWPRLSNTISPHHIALNQCQSISQMMAKITTSVNLEPIDLVGFSMGGYVALQYALTYPQAIKRLIIIAATGTSLTKQEQRRRHHILRYMKTNPYNGIPTQRLKQFIHPDNINSPAADTIRQMDKALGKETLVAQLQATAQRPSLLSQLHTLKCQVLIIGSNQDKLVQPQEIETLGSHFSCATIKFINQGGHMTPLEAPQQLATMINGFFLDDN